jgi:hypothetical protein
MSKRRRCANLLPLDWPLPAELGAVSGERVAGAGAGAANGKKDDDAAAAAPAASGAASAPPARPGGRLAEKGYTPLQSAAAFSAKAVVLAATCYVLANYSLPRLALTELFSKWAFRAVQYACPLVLAFP